MIRGGAGESPFKPTNLIGLPLIIAAPRAPNAGTDWDSSTIEFHAPQESHFPDHLPKAAPQDWQVKDVDFRMP
jgi:hypothetical protein